MELKHTNNEVTEVFLQNENLQTQKFIVAYSSKRKTYKNNSSSIKYGLSELSNDITYLETELPARKRLKSETELFNTTKYPNKTCRPIVNDDEYDNFVYEEKYSNSQKVLLNAEVDTQTESSVLKSHTYNSVFQSHILDNQLKLDSNKLLACNFQKKSDDHDFEPNLENDLCENIHNDISNPGTESQTEFDDEFNKCCELLNLDVPKMAVVPTKIANDSLGSKMIESSHNNKNQSSDTSYTISNKLVASLNFMSNEDSNLETNSIDKKLKAQNEFLNKKEKSDDNIQLKDEGISVSYTITSNSFLTTCDANFLNINDKVFYNEIKEHGEDDLLESEFKDNKNISTFKINNILSDYSKSVEEPNILQTIQNRDSKSNPEHLNLTNDHTLNSDTLKVQGENQEIISQDNLNDNKAEIYGVSSAIDDSDDILSFFDETEEISKTNESESARQSEKSGTVSHASPVHDNKTNTYTGYEFKKKDYFIFNEKIDQVEVNQPLDDKNCELHLGDISNNNCSKNNFDFKIDESFVSEYEISLLAEDDDQILSEESFDSEYEISLLEEDSNDEENPNDLCEDKSDSKVGSNQLPDDEKFTTTKEYENEQITDIVNLPEKETDKVISKTKVQSKSKSKRNTSSLEEIIPSNCQKNNKVADRTDSDLKISVQKEVQTFRNIQSSENTNDKNEQNIRADTSSKIFIKLKKPTNLRPVNPVFKEELTENNYSRLPSKIEINIESQIPNKKIINSNGLKNLEEKAVIVKTNKHLADSACTNKASVVKIVKRELEVPDIAESKRNINNDFQSSNEVDFNKRNGTKKSEEKVLITHTNKQLTDSACTNKASVVKIVKRELEVPDIGESKRNINNNFQSSNEVDFNKRNGTKKTEVKVLITHTNKQLTDSACTNKATIAKIVKTELKVPNIGESKQNVNEKFQPSNEVVFNRKINGTKKSEERVLITYTNKQLKESTCSDKDTGEKTVKTDLGVSASGEIKQDLKDIIPDYYEEEKEDLMNPGWNSIKELSTDEERYRQVRDCWNSKNIPNPFKNLTYYSYRKRKFNCGEDNTRQTRQHKRHASCNLEEKNAKRSRSCTYIFDDRIHSIEKERDIEKKALKEKMFEEVDRLKEQQYQEEMGMQTYYGSGFDSRRQLDLCNLRRDYQQRVSSVTADYQQKVHSCYNQYSSEIMKLKNNRKEVLQFYSFYKGLNANEYKDPTILTNAQMQELEEIENIYNQMDLQYR